MKTILRRLFRIRHLEEKFRDSSNARSAMESKLKPKTEWSLKALLLISLFLISHVCSAGSKLSETFGVGIIGRVCRKGKCENYSQIYSAQADLKESAANPGDFVGEVKFSYEIERIRLESVISIVESDYKGKKQLNVFLQTSVENSKADLGSSEVIVRKMSDLIPLAQYSIPLVYPEVKIEPVILVGPSVQSIRRKMLSLRGRR